MCDVPCREAAIKLNLEHYPESVSTWILKGQLHLLNEETADTGSPEAPQGTESRPRSEIRNWVSF